MDGKFDKEFQQYLNIRNPIRKARIAAKLTQSELAEKMGIDINELMYNEKEYMEPSPKMLKLALKHIKN